jgi:hypothetical protein
VFIGLNDLSEEGNWVFSNGDAYDDQFDWMSQDNGGEGGDQDCGMLYFDLQGGFYLYDEECDAKLRYFICEFVN